MSHSCNPMECSPPGSSVHGTSQVRLLDWVAIYFSRGSFQPRDGNCVSCIGKRILYCQPLGKPCIECAYCKKSSNEFFKFHTSWLLPPDLDISAPYKEHSHLTQLLSLYKLVDHDTEKEFLIEGKETSVTL